MTAKYRSVMLFAFCQRLCSYLILLSGKLQIGLQNLPFVVLFPQVFRFHWNGDLIRESQVYNVPFR